MTDQLRNDDGATGHGHLSDEDLAVLADPRLADAQPGEGAPAHSSAQTAAHDHLAACEPCREALAATERALQALKDPAALLEPPAELWDRIAAEIATTSDQDQRPMASVTELRPHEGSRRRRTPLWIPLAAAAAGAVLGGAAVAALIGQDDATEVESPVASPTVVGGATLDPVAADDFTGRAEMVETDDGALELTVQISAAPDPEAGYFEVWLRDEEGTQLISLGAATADSTTFTVPAGIDLSQYPVVDVSHEHFDGDPGHSGTTLGAGPMEGTDT